MTTRVAFHLKRPSTTTTTAILAKIHAAGQLMKVPTGISIEPKKWDAKKQRAKRGTAIEAPVNRRLEAIAAQLVAIVIDLQNEREPITQQTLAARFKAGARAHVEPRDFFASYDDFLEQSTARFRPRTIARHKVTQTHLRAFEKATGARVTFARIDVLFLDRFATFLLTTQKLTSDTTWSTIKPLRAFLRWAHEHGVDSSSDFARFTQRRIPKGQQSAKPYVTLSELEAIQALDLPSGSRLERVRDLFVFQTHTGLRYGDLLTLRPEHVAGDSLHIVTGKNRKAITVPLLPAAAAIWRKYDGRLPRISNQKQNDYLKELARAAGITQPVVVVDYRGTERIERTVEKCDLIGTHSAKRSFVTILRQRGVSVEAICKITGNDRRTIETYLVGTSEDAEREIRTAWSE